MTTATETGLSVKEARAIAKEAYIYCFPMAANYRTMYTQDIDKTSKDYRGNFNTVYSSKSVATPEDKFVVTPNSDTPYSYLWMDLRAEPLVVTMPKIEPNRYYTAQLIDLYTFNFAYLGTRAYGNDGGSFLIAGPGWNGETPKGIRAVIRCETQFAYALFRTQLFNLADLAAVNKIQDSYRGEPLSSFLHQPAPPAAPAVNWPKPADITVQSADIFPVVNFLLQFCPPNPAEKDLLARFAKLNIGAGKTFNFSSFSPEIQQAINDGIKDTDADFLGLQKRINAEEVSSGDMFGTRDYLKGNYLFRYCGAKLGLYGNSKQDAIYLAYFVDAKDQPLDASKSSYELRFAKGNFPPNKAFWSLTMYDGKSQFLVENPLKRYLLNSTRLESYTYGSDGSLTFYVSREDPGAAKQSNWLPAPDGPFYCVLRDYMPGDAVLDGSWKKPPLQPVERPIILSERIIMSSTTLTPASAASAAPILGTPAGTVMTPDYVATIARFAYIWGWPLVNNMNRALAVEKLPGPGRIGGIVPASPPGRISMLTDYIDAEERFVTCPNQDTVYGAAYQRTNTIPVVIQVPDFGGRFFTYQICDARTESFGKIGKQYGTKPGFYALVGPKWKGEMPKGITGVLHAPTDIVAVFPRVFQDDTPEDKAAVQALLSQVVVYPLAEFDGKMKTMDWKSTPSFPAPQSTGGETKWVIPEKFFDELQVILKQVPPLPGEEAIYSTFQSVLDGASKDSKLKDVLTQTAVAAEKDLTGPLFEFHNNGRPVGNGWTSPPNGANWGYDYLSRAATARSNMYDNAPQETRYFYTDFDSTNQRLNGANAYTVTFAAGQTPPVDGFWSLTVYNKEHLFAPNQLNRYSLGTKSKSMKTGSDGSLTIYVQNDSPGADKETNWLPAPKEDFSLFIRAYWPKAEITEGKWTAPLIERGK